MNDLQKKLDRVISNVQSKMIESGNLLPVKIENGIQIGLVKIVNRDTLKDIYYNDNLIAEGMYLNKTAIKIGNLAAVSYIRYQLKIKEIQAADRQFGDALTDYLFFREKYRSSLEKTDNDRSDIFMARMCFSKDRAAYYKKQALRLAQ
jgi:hypothetical protein